MMNYSAKSLGVRVSMRFALAQRFHGGGKFFSGSFPTEVTVQNMWMFLKTVDIRNDMNVAVLHRLSTSCFIPFWV